MIARVGRDERSVYERARDLIRQARPSRRVTAEWIAGRLYVPVPIAAAVLLALADNGIVRLTGEQGADAAFVLAPPSRFRPARRAMVGLAVLSAAIATVVAGAQFHHIFFFVLGLGLGLLIAFAWLDWVMGAQS